MKSWEGYQEVIERINLRFNLKLQQHDLGNTPARSELALDKIYRVSLSKMRGEWTIHDSNHCILDWLSDIGIESNEAILEKRLESVIPRNMRGACKIAFERKFQKNVNVLKPHSTVFGALVITFFVCIPLAYSFDWFISGLIASACLIGIYLLNRFPTEFAFQTFHDLSEEIRRKQNEIISVSGSPISAETRQSLKAFIDESYREISKKQTA